MFRPVCLEWSTVLGLIDGRLLARLLANRTLCTGEAIVGPVKVSLCMEQVSWSRFSDHVYIVMAFHPRLSKFDGEVADFAYARCLVWGRCLRMPLLPG